MIEIWKNIQGYEGLYQISNLGRVKSLHYNKEKILKPNKYGAGYYGVALSKNNKHKRYSIHRLVAIAFIPNPNNLPQVNHKDEDKTNNRVDNLEWCTNEYNMNYGTRNERANEKISETVRKKFENGYISPFKNKHHTEDVKNYLSEINSNANHPRATRVICVTTNKIFDTTKQAGEYYNIDASQITKCCKGIRKSAGKLSDGTKLVWRYI